MSILKTFRSVFFKEEELQEGIITMSDFLGYYNLLSKKDKENLATFFLHLNKKRNMSISNIYTTRNGTKLVYVKVFFKDSTAGQELVIPVFDEFVNFHEYLFDYVFDLNLMELVESAKKKSESIQPLHNRR